MTCEIDSCATATIGEARPRVSVVVPNYNYARFLDQRLQSILSQTFQDFEIILLDDASTDHSRDIIAKYASIPRVRIVLNEQNSGSAFKQWNRGVEMARGDLVWIAEADDYADPRLLTTLVACLDRDTKVGMAYCQSFDVDESGEVLGTKLSLTDPLDKRRWQSDFVSNGQNECREFLIRFNTIPNASGVVFRRRLYQEVGNADENLKQTGDWLMWAKLLLNSDLAFSSEPMNYFRRHNTLIRVTSWTTGSMIAEFYTVMLFISRRVSVDKAVLNQSRTFMREIWLAPQNFRRWNWGCHLRTLLVAMQFDPRIVFAVIGATIGLASEKVRIRLSGLARRLRFLAGVATRGR